MKKIFAILAPLALFFALVFPMSAKEIGQPKGFNKKLYDATFALSATSVESHVTTPKFLCTVTAIQHYEDGYLLIGAGHCTTVNPELPDDLMFSIASTLNQTAQPVELIKAVMHEDFDDPSVEPRIDYALFYLKTKEKLPIIPLGDEGSLRIGSKTVNVNFSFGLAKYVSPGIVSSVVATSGTAEGFYGVQMFDSHGASGSSVVDAKTKKIVGLVIAGVDGATVPAWIEPISKIETDLIGLNFDTLIQHPDVPKVIRDSEWDDSDFLFSNRGGRGSHRGSPRPPSREEPRQHSGHTIDRPTFDRYFGRTHCFRPEIFYSGGFYSFEYAGIWFDYEFAWPYPADDIFIDVGADGFYYMSSPAHPGVSVQVWIP
jgi:Trypsin-like peptidase domain